MSTIKAVLNNDIIYLNAIPEAQVSKIAEDERTLYEDIWYFNPDDAQIAPDAPDKPGDCYYWDSELEEWVLNESEELESTRLQKIREIKAEKAKQIYGNAYIDTGDAGEAMFELTAINRQILTSKTQDFILFGADIDAIFTGNEMPKIKIADETWITVPPEKCLPWAKQVSLLTQMAFNKEYESQEAIDSFKDEVEAETKTLQEFIAFDFIAEYNTNLKAAIQDHDNFAYPEQYYNSDL